MPLLVLGLNHRTASVTLRERFAISESHLPDSLRALRDAGLAEEAVILSTCNRVELYVVTDQAPGAVFDALRRHLCQAKDTPLLQGDELYELTEPESLEHLFKVAAGMDSMVLGETEILGQLKKAYDLSLRLGFTGKRLNQAFQKAFHVAKQIRTETNIQRGNVSVGSVAVELAEKIFTHLDSRHVMVIGAGDTSEKTARALLSRGAKSILVSNRSYDRALHLARELHGRAVHFEEWAREFSNVDIVISSTAAPHYVLDRGKLEPLMKQRHQKPLLLIDIAVPRDVDPEVNFLENVFLYNIDDLQAIADQYMRQRRDELDRCARLIAERARAMLNVRPHPPSASPPRARPAFGHD